MLVCFLQYTSSTENGNKLLDDCETVSDKDIEVDEQSSKDLKKKRRNMDKFCDGKK